MRGRGERRQGGQQYQSVDVPHLTSRNNMDLFTAGGHLVLPLTNTLVYCVLLNRGYL